MVNYKDGILKLNFSKDILEVLWNVSFFLRMLSIICFGNVKSLYYASFFLFVGVSFAEAIIKRKISSKIFIPLHTVWYGLFIALGIISSIWADNFSLSFVPLAATIQILIVTYCLILHIDSYEKLESYISVVIAASLFLVIYIFVMTPPDRWFAGFLGTVTKYNTNDIGCALSIAVIFSYYKGTVKHKRIMYILCAIFFFAVILTSSRKSLFMSVIGIVMIAFLNVKAKNYILRIFAIIAMMILAIVLIYKVPFLYNTVGVRLDSMKEHFISDNTADSSIVIRQYFIDMAKQFYYENPIFGIGLNNFSHRISFYGDRSSYAHNNYWEIAADLGTVGLITYYWFYIYVSLKLLKQIFKGHKTAVLFMPLMILFLVFEYGMVNYYKTQVHLVIAAAFIAIVLNDKSDDKKYFVAESSR